nr:hypothetical protein [Tanacetum cinerariifolium]
MKLRSNRVLRRGKLGTENEDLTTMKLRSNRVLKRAKQDIENRDFSDNLSNGENGASEGEIEVCADDENIEMGMNDGVNVNVDDKGVYLGSEVLDPVKDSVVSSLKLDRQTKRKIADRLDGRVKKGKVEKDEDHVSMRVLRSRTMTTISDGTMVVDGGLREMVLGLKRLDESIQLAGNDGHTMAVDGGLCEKDLDLKRLDESIQLAGNDRHKRKSTRHVRPPNIYVDENPRPKKKLKRRERPSKFPIERRGRPRKIVPQDVLPKFPIERRGRPRKIVPQDVLPKFPIERRGRPRKIIPQDVLPKFPIERRGRPRKIVPQDVLPKFPIERRGRPRKIVPQDVQVGPTKLRVSPRQFQGKETRSQRVKDLILKKVRKHRGKPIKREARTLATHVLKMRTVKLIEIKNGPEIQKKETIKEGEENGERLARWEQKQLIREKISDMLLNSGWTIDLRQRPERTNMDVIYVEPNRKRAHWSTTKAYAMLKKKIEEGNADDNEISAFYPIPQEEISMLFRQTKKKLGVVKKKNRRQKKKVTKGKIVTNKKKKVFKNAKNGSKKKHGKKITERSKPRLLARGSEKGSQKDNNGGLVTKNRNLLSFMIDSGVILVGSKVQYGKTRRKIKSYEGTITSDGICCSCCNEVMGISEFVSHSGGNTGQGFDNVYLESGMCLRKCLVDSWRREEELNSLRFDFVVDVKGDDRNDDACNICGDGGDLICCDSCPSTFHQSCLEIQSFPSGDWNCNYCSASEMLSCCLCEDKFHLSCLQEVVDVNIESDGRSFCGRKCQELYKQLHTYLGVKHELEDGFSWTLLQRSDIDQDQDLTLHDAQLKVEQNSKLAVAFSVMDECFLPINDRRSGTNIIQNVVYNCSSNFKRLNYSGFVTAVLEKGDELITVASIRVHGYRLAEMPFIGTRQMYRRQGMCRRLLDAIESCLSSIGVEELIIPAIPELLQTWTKVFGFMPPEESLKQAMKGTSMIVFPGIDMLNKSLLQNQDVNANSSPSTASDENIVECNKKQNDENVTQLESMSLSYKEHARKDVIDLEQTREDVIIDNEQSEEPTVKKPVDAADDVNDVSGYEQTTKEVLMDRCSCPSVKNDKLVTSKSAEGLCDLNFPLSNGGPCDTDSQVDSEPFQDGTNEQTSMDFMTSEVKVKPSPLTSELVPKNTFDLNLQPSGVEIDMNILSDDSVQCES